jgi:hypothetical protein
LPETEGLLACSQRYAVRSLGLRPVAPSRNVQGAARLDRTLARLLTLPSRPIKKPTGVGCFIGGDGEIHSSIKIKYLQNQYHSTQKKHKTKNFSYFVLIQRLATTTGSEFQHFAGFDTAMTDSPQELYLLK